MSVQDETELMLSELFDSYADAYEEYDSALIADCFAFPCVVWQLEEGHVFKDKAELCENIDALLEVHREHYVTSSIYEVVSSHISGSTASVSLDWQQEDDEGEVVFDFTCHYLLINIEGAWKIASIVNEPA
ncbi:hypothetical protein PsAD2_02443 [Pseudovibrio axinellae]|uniref:DUF4440 domain-containing protein n=1 Tax=Pseudovibrio axinellae TaxID=989403 RepID=A0A165YKP4_9HYPH|nr:DUF4440 domain-containing protein [Pseudovibrio axinellae]KZL18927.1 hypothetical protein PsAD2_02443 [Pseudovibrio axinellae]SEP87448.1 protein of unknown function [Pseudovibrio axinellae]